MHESFAHWPNINRLSGFNFFFRILEYVSYTEQGKYKLRWTENIKPHTNKELVKTVHCIKEWRDEDFSGS